MPGPPYAACAGTSTPGLLVPGPCPPMAAPLTLCQNLRETAGSCSALQTHARGKQASNVPAQWALTWDYFGRELGCAVHTSRGRHLHKLRSARVPGMVPCSGPIRTGLHSHKETSVHISRETHGLLWLSLPPFERKLGKGKYFSKRNPGETARAPRPGYWEAAGRGVAWGAEGARPVRKQWLLPTAACV